MAVLKTAVAKSYNVEDAALNLNVKAYEARRTLAAVWNVEPTPAEPPAPEAVFSLDMTNGSQESVVGPEDGRTLVDKAHFAPGGKYRSIIKLFIHYEFQNPGSWAHGTGWLIKPDVFVTAGHCSYDWGHRLGRATQVKSYIGYDGHESEQDPNVQFRQVKKIVTTEGWVRTKGSKPFDVSFMQVDKPFTGVTPVRYDETPSHGSLSLGVVGYPGDLYDQQTKEKGAHMYEMFLPTDFDLTSQGDTMLEYQIDTYGGNSGSPVLRQQDLVSIGAHVYGGTFNSASVIGMYGNPYQDYIAALNLPVPGNSLNMIPVNESTASATSGLDSKQGSLGASGLAETQRGSQRASTAQSTLRTPAVAPRATQSQHQRRISSVTKAIQNGRADVIGQSDAADEEGFMEVLKVVASALPSGLGLLGGGPIGALAGFALNTASKLIAENATEESSLPDPTLQEGSIERAILAEATLSVLQSSELHPDLEESIFSDIKDTVMGALPVVRKAAPRVLGAMMEPALMIALNSLHKYNQKMSSGAESFEVSTEPFRSTIVYSRAIDQPGDRQAEAFLGHLHTALQQNSQESAIDGGEEGLIDVIQAGARLAGQGVLAAAKHGLPILADLLKQTGSAEAFDEEASSSHLAADPLAQRALVADAALTAVMKLPAQKLAEGGFFEGLSRAVKAIAPVALKFAPVVLGKINPILGGIVSNVLKQESAIDEPAMVGRGRLRLGAGRGLSTRGSLHSLREDGVGVQKNERRNRLK